MLAGNGEIDEVHGLAKSLGIEERVDIPGWLSPEACERELESASIYVLPTQAEGLPLGLLEAMSFGLPVVTSRAGGIPSLIEDGVNGLLVRADDPTELAHAINAILDDESLRKRLGENARLTIEHGYSIDAVISSLVKEYEDLVSSAAQLEPASGD